MTDRCVWYEIQTVKARLFEEEASHSERTVCECVVEHRSNHSDNTEGKETWLRIASEHRLSECGELEKKFDVIKCPWHANLECILKRIDELKCSKKLFSMKSERDEGLSSCSNFQEKPTETKLAANKPVLLEIEHSKCKYRTTN